MNLAAGGESAPLLCPVCGCGLLARGKPVSAFTPRILRRLGNQNVITCAKCGYHASERKWRRKAALSNPNLVNKQGGPGERPYNGVKIYAFTSDGTLKKTCEVQGPPVGAITVWRALEKAYLPVYRPDYIKEKGWYREDMSDEELLTAFHSGSNGGELSRINAMRPKAMQEIYDLVDDEQVPVNERLVLATTVPNKLLRREHIPAVTSALRNFRGLTVLIPQADVLDKLLEDHDVAAVGWKQGPYFGIDWEHAPHPKFGRDGPPYNFVSREDLHTWIE